jgi:CHAT domain-containing protein
MIRPFAAALSGIALALPLPAAAASLQLVDSFRIGNAGVLCTAQSRVADPALVGMFDRGYRIVCRDAAAPVGKLFALRTITDPAKRLAAARPADMQCEAPRRLDDPLLPGVEQTQCQQAGLAYSIYSVVRGNTLYSAEGFTGYGSALRLGLAALLADAPVTGTVEVASTEAGDQAAFARIQAGSLDPAQALSEGYVRNNASSFAEASAFFDLLVERNRQGSPGFNRSGEYLSNQALQQSNLGNFAEADTLFAQAAPAIDRADQVVVRLDRNFRAMHELNRHHPEAALQAIETTRVVDITGLDKDRVAVGYIDVPLAQRLNADDTGLGNLSRAEARLTPEERAAILDAQAEYLRGAAFRQLRRDAEAEQAFGRATRQLDAVRQGKVTSATWLKAGIDTERAILAERAGRGDEARAALASAVALYAADYPGSATLLVAQARLAALLARQGKTDEAATLFRSIISAAPETPGAGAAVRPLVAPYFGLLVARGAAAGPASGAAANDFFDASQILVRPGVAQTQAVLARELSGGSDAAAGLFRQSVNLSRDIVRLDAEIAQAVAASPAVDPAVIAGMRSRREELGTQQTAVLARLSEFPRYRSVSNDVVRLADLQARLGDGEAYYKLVLIGDDAYALFATRDNARILTVGASASELGAKVAALRASIITYENGRPRTDPFDAATARMLYKALFTAVEAELPGVRHLVFEPDGAMLQLPINLLIAADDGIEAYERRVADTGNDAYLDTAYDMRGIAWLGRSRMVSTAVSPRAFLDLRAIAPSRAGRSYLGLGENAKPEVSMAAGKSLIPARRDLCDWPLSEWERPISAAELKIGAGALGRGSADVVTGVPFTDTAIMARQDLRDFHVIHFATHGLVTAPRAECPARPALLTSFGGTGSDGLLSFREIFDLQLDADTIILSACDTAGTATSAATREAGVATGGNYALDGLVRAFVGAGARSVIASHWPVPDDFNATGKLITGLFAPSASVGEALRVSQVQLMDDARTSHPYYWSGFAIIGDAAKPLTSAARSDKVAVAP